MVAWGMEWSDKPDAVTQVSPHNPTLIIPVGLAGPSTTPTNPPYV